MGADSVKIIFTIAGLHPESGGPSQSVTALAAALGDVEVDTEILTLHYGRMWKAPVTPPTGQVRLSYADCSSALARRLKWTPAFQKTLRASCRAGKVEIIHDTGLWLLTNHAAAAVSRELDIPRIISPRGMLSHWAIRHKGWKKSLAWKLYQHRDLAGAQVLHATSEAEAEDFRQLGLRQPIAMIPNGVELPETATVRAKNFCGNVKTILFLSRIHPKKGLLDLVNAWAEVRVEGWRIVIAGGDDNGHRAEVEALVKKLGLSADFYFTGEVDHKTKWEQYRQADIFVLPSHSENFGIVVAEALACGVPVITTRRTPWESLRTHRCGWWVEDDVADLSRAFRAALLLTDAERRDMGDRGRKLVEASHDWRSVGGKMKSVYEWMLRRGPLPDCIRH